MSEIMKNNVISSDLHKYKEQVENFASQFMTDQQIADKIGVCRSSVYRVRKEYSIESGSHLWAKDRNKKTILMWNKTKDIDAVTKSLGVKNSSHIVSRLKILHNKGEVDFSEYIKKEELEKKRKEISEDEKRNNINKIAKDMVLNDDFLKFINQRRSERGASPL